MRSYPLGFVLIMLARASLAAEPSAEDFPPPTTKLRLRAVRATERITVDGKLDEADWARARLVDDFKQIEPNQGAKATLKTTVRVLFDDRAVYFSARCDDPEGRKGIQQKNLQRDFSGDSSDLFGVVLDTLGDGRNAFGFYVNPWGAQGDVQVIDDQLYEENWDTVWSSAVTRDDAGWTVELALPWKSLRRAPGHTEWGLQLVRTTRRLNEDVGWSPWPHSLSPFRMPYAGILEGLEPPENGLLDVQLRPYAIVRTERAGADPFVPRPTGGGEVTWSPTAGSVLDLTANTDFAETDVDRRVVNLGRFSVFFPEKRQFFLENAGVFNPGEAGFVRPFFSRAIGLASDQRVPINAGARFVARSAQRSFGALVVNTAPLEENAGSLFGVTRYTQNVGEQGRLGGMLVFRQDFARGALAPVTNLVPVADAMARLGPVTLTAMATASATQVHDGSAPAFGGAGTVDAFVQGNWGLVGATVSGVSPGYDPRTGFLGREELLGSSAFVYLDTRPKWLPSWIRSLNHYSEGFVAFSTRDGSFQEAYAYFEPVVVRSSSGDRAWFSVTRNWQALGEAFEPVPGVAMAAGSYEYDLMGLSVYSEPSRVVSAGGNLSWGHYYRASYLRAYGQLGVQPIPHVSLAFNYGFNRFEGEGVRPGGAETHLLVGEARLALTPRLQLIGSYQRDTAGNVGLLNARIAWEFLPLSFVYVVFTDSRAAFPALDAPVSEQRFVVKVTYTWRP